MEMFNVKELNEVQGKEQYRVEISLENLDTEVGINSGWETLREDIKISACPVNLETGLCLHLQVEPTEMSG
jgi:hypothetical protein